MAKAETREMKQGFGDAFAAAFELVITPVSYTHLTLPTNREV